MSSSTPKKHVAVIGAGPGGYVCAIRLAQLGHRVTVIEAQAVGGVCLNWGCIPSKALIHAAATLEQLAEAEQMGISTGPPVLDMAKLQAWKAGIVAKLTQGIAGLFKRHDIELIAGRATFTDAHTLSIEPSIETDQAGPKTLKPDAVVIATGSSIIELPHLPFDHNLIIDSTDALNLTKVPRHLVLIGGGVIGLELGVLYARLGAKVSVVELLPQLLPGMDADVVKQLTRSLKKRKLALYLQAKVTELARQGASASLSVETPKGTETLDGVDAVLVAVGRRPNSDKLGLKAAGVQTDDRGFIVVDRQLRTSQPHVFAIGDVTSAPLLAHKASKEGLVAAHVIDGQPDELDVKAMPSAVFTTPEIATVGLTEAAAQNAGYTVRTGQFPFAASGRALSMNDTEGFVKVVADAATDTLLGVHMIGPHVGDLIAEAALAIEMGACAEDLALTVHAHPTLPESLMEAAEAVHHQAIHMYQPPVQPDGPHRNPRN
ncbi:MAG: dihydrolipoyl dehydrogenase, partial [Cyanobacteria bacterium HKST-UBA03]|nr:dihydrolipoyl dehydrogenase [Cyanobacteria bacterium HKST-UBA03]